MSIHRIVTLAGIFIIALSQSNLARAVEPWDLLPAVEQAPMKERFIKDLRTHPLETYTRVYSRALEAKNLGLPTFSFEEMKPVVLRMQLITQLEMSKQDSPSAIQIQLATVANELDHILKNNIPYHDLMRASLKLSDLLDQLTRTRHPGATYSRFYEENELVHFEAMLKEWPNHILFPSFASISQGYFLDTRVVPIYLIGLAYDQKFIDGFNLSPKELFLHDVGHSRFMMREDKALIGAAQLPLLQMCAKEHVNKINLDHQLNQIKQIDIDLSEAIDLLLFEILHERGYNYSIPNLVLQLETDRWTQVIRRKAENHFWEKSPKASTLKQLETARSSLYQLVRKIAESKTVQELQKTLATTKSWKIKYSAVTLSGSAQIRAIHIAVPGQLQVEIHSEHFDGVIPVSDLSLAQINITKFLSMEEKQKINSVFTSEHGGQEWIENLPLYLQSSSRPLTAYDFLRIQQLFSLFQANRSADFSTFQPLQVVGKFVGFRKLDDGIVQIEFDLGPNNSEPPFISIPADRIIELDRFMI